MSAPSIVLNVNGIEVIYNHVILVLKGVSLQVPEGGIADHDQVVVPQGAALHLDLVDVGPVGALQIDDVVAGFGRLQLGVVSTDRGRSNYDVVRVHAADLVPLLIELDAALDLIAVDFDQADAPWAIERRQ